MRSEFQGELESLINKFSQEKGSDTPDFILAEYLNSCLAIFDRAVGLRERWYGRGMFPEEDKARMLRARAEAKGLSELPPSVLEVIEREDSE